MKAVGDGFGPKLRRFGSESLVYGLSSIVGRLLTALMLVCAAVFLGVALFLPSLVQVPAVHRYIKPAYWVGLSIVPVILLGYVFSGMYAVVTAGLYIERKTAELPWIAGAGAVLNIAVCIVGESRWGMVGVAWATPASYALMAALGARRANRVYPVPFEWRRVAHIGVIVLAIFLADRVVASRGVVPLSSTGLGIKAVLLLALPLALVATGFFRRGEWRALRALLPVPERM
jgi:O-antigen/teichoic acid export membrane protein